MNFSTKVDRFIEDVKHRYGKLILDFDRLDDDELRATEGYNGDDIPCGLVVDSIMTMNINQIVRQQLDTKTIQIELPDGTKAEAAHISIHSGPYHVAIAIKKLRDPVIWGEEYFHLLVTPFEIYVIHDGFDEHLRLLESIGRYNDCSFGKLSVVPPAGKGEPNDYASRVFTPTVFHDKLTITSYSEAVFTSFEEAVKVLPKMVYIAGSIRDVIEGDPWLSCQGTFAKDIIE